MSNRTPRPGGAQRTQSRAQPGTPSATAVDADRALANIRAWSDMLIARGNRLLELAVRERQSVAGIPPRSSRGDRDTDAARSRPVA